MIELIVGWWFHIKNMLNIFSAEDKWQWFKDHLDSVVVFLLTLAIISLIILTYDLERESYSVPAGQERKVNRFE